MENLTEEFKATIKSRVEKLGDAHLMECLGNFTEMLSKKITTDDKIKYAYEMLHEQAVKRRLK